MVVATGVVFRHPICSLYYINLVLCVIEETTSLAHTPFASSTFWKLIDRLILAAHPIGPVRVPITTTIPKTKVKTSITVGYLVRQTSV